MGGVRVVIAFAFGLMLSCDDAGCFGETDDAAESGVPIECCRMCTMGKPCGDTCIDAESTCQASPGCACAAEQEPEHSECAERCDTNHGTCVDACNDIQCSMHCGNFYQSCIDDCTGDHDPPPGTTTSPIPPSPSPEDT